MPLLIGLQYTLDAFQAAQSLKEWSPISRYIIRYFLPQVRRIDQLHKAAANLIGPLVRERLDRGKSDHLAETIDSIDVRSILNLRLIFTVVHTDPLLHSGLQMPSRLHKKKKLNSTP